MSKKGLVLFVTLASLLMGTLLSLPFLIENHLGENRWAELETKLLDAGLQLDIDDFVVEMPPDEENFAASPLIKSLWDFTKPESDKESVIYTNPDLREQFLTLSLPKYENPNLMGSWLRGEHMDLAGIVELLASDNQFTVPKTGRDGTKILAAIEPYADLLNELESDALKKTAQLPVRFANSFTEDISTPIPWANEFRQHALFHKVRAIAALSEKAPQTALNSIRVIFQMGQTAESHPFLIGALLRLTMYRTIEDIVWEGLSNSSWRQSDLQSIEKILSAVDLLSELESSFNFEMVAMIMQGCDYMRDHGTAEDLASMLESKPLPNLFRLIPQGIWDHNKSFACEYLFDHCISPLQRQEFANVAQMMDHPVKTTPRNFFAKVLAPAYDGVLRGTVHRQANLKLIELACVLERFRLSEKNYPENLVELIPEYLEKSPIDIMSPLEPIVYHRTVDGYQIYSLGINGTDDFGFVGWTSQGKRKWRESDWVWRVPALKAAKQ